MVTDEWVGADRWQRVTSDEPMTTDGPMVIGVDPAGGEDAAVVIAQRQGDGHLHAWLL